MDAYYRDINLNWSVVLESLTSSFAADEVGTQALGLPNSYLPPNDKMQYQSTPLII